MIRISLEEFGSDRNLVPNRQHALSESMMTWFTDAYKRRSTGKSSSSPHVLRHTNADFLSIRSIAVCFSEEIFFQELGLH